MEQIGAARLIQVGVAGRGSLQQQLGDGLLPSQGWAIGAKPGSKPM